MTGIDLLVSQPNFFSIFSNYSLKKSLKRVKKNQFLQKMHSKSPKPTKKLLTLDFKSK
jgi:hypothetical protein